MRFICHSKSSADAARVDFATDADIDAMTGLLAELFALEQDFSPERDKQAAGLRLILENPSMGQLFVLRCRNEVIGMASALITVSTAEGSKVILLEDVVIRSGFRGLRLGRLLIERIQAWARERGFARLTLLADRNNRGAIAFYRHLGFGGSAMRVLRKSLQVFRAGTS